MENKIIQRIQTIQDQLLDNQLLPASQFSFNLRQVDWDNKDNIGHGALGQLFFLLETYRYSKDQKCLEFINDQLEKIETFWQEHPTNNYTFFYGRSGLIYFYLDYYDLEHKEVYLNKALQIAREYQHTYSSLFLLSGNNSLYDGISGTLLVFMRLFAYSKEEWLLSLIEELVLKLIRNTRIGREGLYWNGIHSERILHNVGYAYGNSGIALAFTQVARFFDNDAFLYLSQLAFQFEKAHLEKDSILWTKLADLYHKDKRQPQVYSHSLEYGLAGMLLPRWSYLKASKELDSEIENQVDLTLFLEHLEEVPNKLLAPQASMHYHPIEWGMLALEMYHLSGEQQHWQTATKIAEFLLGQPNKTNPCLEGYFFAKYLQTQEKKYHPAFVFPNLNAADDIVFENLELDSPLFFGLEEINSILLKNSFKNAYPKLLKALKEDLETFNEKAHSNLFTAFQQEVKRLKHFDPKAPEDQILRIAFEKDCYIISEISHSILSSFSEQKDSVEQIGKIVENIALPDERFMDLRFSFSEDVWLLEYDPTIELDQILTYDEISKLVSDYGSQSFVFFRTPEDLGEQELFIGKLILDRFRSPATVRNVYENFHQFLSKQIPEVVSIIDMGLDEVMELNLEQKSKMLVIGSVKYLYEEGILELA